MTTTNDIITNNLSKRGVRIGLLVGMFALLLIPLTSSDGLNSVSVSNPDGGFNRIPVAANIDESTPWWNASYHYRQYINLTDTNSTPRVNVPTEIEFSFENNTCYINSIRIVDGNGDEVPSQPYNFVYWEDQDFVKSATIFWYANISADSTATYWLYFSADTSLESTNYESIVSFARTTGTLSGKFGLNYWSFKGDWYNVTMLSASGGKMTNGAHKMDDGSWNWDWGTNYGSMHWNPDGLAGQTTSNTAPIASTTFVNEEGPLFINYTTQLPFGSYAKLNVTYTFYKWGWTTRIWIQYSATVSGSGRTDEWVFRPYQTTYGLEIAEDLTQTYYSNWAASSNKGKPAGFGWWNDNGVSHGTVRISHDSWDTDPAYTNNYGNFYYRWYDTSSYEFWDTVIPTIYAQAGTVLEETTAFPVWNGAEGLDGYMRVFNATSRFLPVQQELGNVSSYSFKINVNDLGGSNIEGVNLTLLNPSTGEKLFKASGDPYSALTDSDGNVTFIGLLNQSYRIDAWIDSRTWLNEEGGSTGMNVTWTDNRVADGPFTPVGITLDLASIDIHLTDLMGDDLASIGSQNIQVRVYNASDSNRANWKYLDYQYTDSTGNLTFTRLPKCDWVFNFTYSNTDTGHIFTEADFGLYCTYSIDSADITTDLSRPNWQLPLVTLDFNVKAYDGENVEDAFIRLTKRNTGDSIAAGVTDHYNITHSTDSNGDVTFYRVLNGTWNIFLYRTDDYGQTAFNNTESVDDIQDYQQKDMIIPLTWLRVLVEDSSANRVPSAQIDLNVNGLFFITAYTDTSGWYNFTLIKANDTSIPWIYTIDVSKLTSSNSMIVYASLNYLYYNSITIANLAYDVGYTELNSTTSTYSWKYGDNQTFVIGWYNRTGPDEASAVDTPLSSYDDGWLNFSIMHQGQLVDIGWWNGTYPWYVAHEASDGIYFTIIIDTIFFKMNASNYPYQIKINGSALGYTDTDIYTITVVITVASTVANGLTSDSPYWSDGFLSNYSLTTNPYGRSSFNITGLDFYNYTVYDSIDQVVATGLLTHLGSGVYEFTNALLNGSDAGSYDIVIWLRKQNYVNHTISVSITILPVPTILSWTAPPVNYDWGSGSQTPTLYFMNNLNSTAIDVSGATIILYWINDGTGQTILIDTSTSWGYDFDHDIVANGTWRIHAYVSKDNFVSDDESSVVFLVSPAVSTIALTSSATVTVEWGSEYAEFDFDYDDANPIIGAELFEISWTGEFELIDNGDGSYQLRLLAVQEAANYTFSYTMWIENRTLDTQSITVNVLIPLEITAEDGISEQNPTQQYWTRNYTLVIVAGDLSNQSAFVFGAAVTYSFAAGGTLGSLSENATGEYYYLEFPASSAPGPGIYEIIIEASRSGCTTTTSSIYIEVLATPSQANAETMLMTIYYADAYNLNFTWLTTIDGNEGITSPDSILVQLWKGVTQVNDSIGGVLDLGSGSYTFSMDTRSLGMTADLLIAPTSYYFVVLLTKLGYENPIAVTIIILVLQTPTQMTSETVDPVIWSEQIAIEVNLIDIIHSEYIWADANVTITYGAYSYDFTSLNNGTFVLYFDSDDVFFSSDTAYVVTVSYALPNYIDGSIEVSIIVNPVPAHIVLLDEILSEYDWESTIEVTIAVRLDSDEFIGVNVSSAYYFWTGYEYINGTLVFDSIWNGYLGDVNTGLVPAGVQILNIVVLRANYSIPIITTEMTINELETDLTADVDGALYAVYGVDQSIEIHLAYTRVSNGAVLEGATVTFIWDGLERTASWNAEGYYVFQFNPSVDDSLIIPDIYILTFTASLTNYTTQQELVSLNLGAATEIIGESIRVEEGQVLYLIFAYWDVVNDQPVGISEDITVQYQIGSAEPVTVTASQFNGTHYIVELSSVEIGEINLDPYEIQILVSAPGYQNWTASDVSQYILVYIDSPTVDILGFRIQTDTLFLVITMTMMFVFVGSAAVGFQRWRIPFPIKQINKALKAMQNNKVAKVEGIKSMGDVISELLAPGLMDLNIEVPRIDVVHEPDFDMALGAETEGLLDELDALDDIGVDDTAVDESTDYEAELEAELDSEIEETPEDVVEESVIEEEVVSESEVESDDVTEDVADESESDAEPEAETVTDDEIKAMAEKLSALGVSKEEVEFLIENAASFTRPELDSLVSSLELKQLEKEKESGDEPSEEEPVDEEIENDQGDGFGDSDEVKEDESEGSIKESEPEEDEPALVEDLEETNE